MSKFEEEVTIAIKTYERPNCLKRLLESIRNVFKDIKIIIADDSKKPYPEISKEFGNVEHICLPYYVGVSVGKNAIIDKIETPYTLFLDDDFIFGPKTTVENLLIPIKKGIADLCGGHVDGFPRGGKSFIDNGKTLEITCIKKPGEYPLYDFVVNFFIAKTETLKATRYYEELKTGEHSNFFFRYTRKNGYKVTKDESVEINHKKESYQNSGNTHRAKAITYLKQWIREEGYTSVKNIK